MCSRREVTISTKRVTSEQERHRPLLGLKTRIHFQFVRMRQKGRKQKPLKKIPPLREIPALKEAEIRLLPKAISQLQAIAWDRAQVVDADHSPESFPQLYNEPETKNHDCQVTQRNRRNHTNVPGLYATGNWLNTILGRKLNTTLQRQEEKFPSSPTWGEKSLLFGLQLLFESPTYQQGTPSTSYRQERNCGPET